MPSKPSNIVNQIHIISLQQLKGRPMKNSQKIVAATALSSVLALGLALNSTAALATEKEKCCGVAKAGLNDCATYNINTGGAFFSFCTVYLMFTFYC